MALSFGDITSKIGQSLDIVKSIVDIKAGLSAPKVAAAQGQTSTAPNQLAPVQYYGVSQPGIVYATATPSGSVVNSSGNLLSKVQSISPFGYGAIAAAIGGVIALVLLIRR
jgi:hypothetical protein